MPQLQLPHVIEYHHKMTIWITSKHRHIAHIALSGNVDLKKYLKTKKEK